MRTTTRDAVLLAVACLWTVPGDVLLAQRPNKPVLHGKEWVAITGKPLAATAGARIFAAGGNAVDAACAMLGATATMWDTFGWGGETQALIWHPGEERVIGINAVGVAPTGATPEFFEERDMRYPPQFGPLAAVTPGNPAGLLVMLAEWGTMSLAEVLGPSIEMADGYPIEAQAANAMEARRDLIEQWPYSREVFLPHLDESGDRAAPYAGEIFRQPDLAATLRKLVEAEREALDAGASREEAIHAAYDRFYRGDIAEEFVRGSQEQGGLHTLEDLAGYEVHVEEPVMSTYKGIEVYKLTSWTQGPVLLQTLNILENVPDLAGLGYNSARYVHALYQAMNLAYADRDFYYGDPYYPPEEPLEGLLSKEYARARYEQIDWEANDPGVRPGDPYPYQGGENPFTEYLEDWPPEPAEMETTAGWGQLQEEFYAGTTSVQAADADGWVVSITPSGAWLPAVVAGETGIGMSQRMQSFVVDPAENPYNVVEPGKRPRVTLTPSIALRDGEPFLSFAVQGGDAQDQNLLQFLLNVVEFDMDVQEAVEAANVNSYQMFSSFGDHDKSPGRLLVNADTPPWVIEQLEAMGYDTFARERTSGPINAIFFDREHGTLWGGSSDHGEDYGIAW
ncbi:MAG: gamma-glutamyltransferase family protein [Acidobacteriota bacterium]